VGPIWDHSNNNTGNDCCNTNAVQENSFVLDIASRELIAFSTLLRTIPGRRGCSSQK
jgi:hypothetical protein